MKNINLPPIKKCFDFQKVNNFQKIAHVESVLFKGNLDRAQPEFCIVIPTYKRVDLLQRAVISAINQDTKRQYDIIVVDNDDDFTTISETQKYLMSLKCDYLYYYKNKQNVGGENNFNRGIELARGKYFGFLHDDDYLEKNYIDTMCDNIEDDKAIFCKYNAVKNDKILKSKAKQLIITLKRFFLWPFYLLNKNKNKIDLNNLVIGYPSVGCICVGYNKQRALEIGGFNIDNYPGTDYELNVKYIKENGAKYVRQTVGNYWIGQNDSLKACQLFPQFNHDMRMSLLPLLGKKRNKHLKKMQFYINKDIIGISKSFSAEVNSGDELVKFSAKINKCQKFLNKVSFQIYRTIKYFE